MKKLSLEEAKIVAVNFAKDYLRNNSLFKYIPDEDAHDWSIGEPATLETISSMVVNSGGVIDMDSYEAEVSVLLYLEEIFPDY